MTDQEHRSIIAGNWIEKAREAFAAAEINFSRNLSISCVNRLYYAAFYSVSAALAAEGKDYGKHSAVRAALHREYVKTGRVPLELGKLFDELFEDRQAGDYRPETKFPPEDIGRLIPETRHFVEFFSSFIAAARP